MSCVVTQAQALNCHLSFVQITATIAQNYGHKHCKARHTNFPLSGGYHSLYQNLCSYLFLDPNRASPPQFTRSPVAYLSSLVFGYNTREKEGLKRTTWFRDKGRGYFEEHSTQPQTLGYSLSDSPAGLLAWIYEKLVNWTDNYPWEDDEGDCTSLLYGSGF